MTHLQTYTSKVTNEYINNVYGDPRIQFTTMMKMMVDMKEKLDAATTQLAAMRGSGGRGRNKVRKKKRKLATKNPRLVHRSDVKEEEEENEDVPGTHEAPKIAQNRKGSYRFGNAKINYIK